MSLSSTILMQSQNIVINKWFPTNEYGMASGLIATTPLATVCGMAASGLYFIKNKDNAIGSLNDLIFHANIAASVIFILFLVSFRDKPVQSPSAVAQQELPKR